MASSSEASRDFYIGLILAASSSLFIGSSFIVKKKGLLKLQLRAGQGGFGYLKEGVWWAGFLLMAIGEGANFLAYAFAPATLVTPLGALSVLVSAVLASHLLNEQLNLLGKIGCAICVLGSIVLVIHSPKSQEHSMEELMVYLANPLFVLYVVAVGITAVVLIFYVSPKHGASNPLVYVTVVGTVGSLSVLSCKGLGVALKETIAGHNQLDNWLTWIILFSLAFNISVQMNYLNKALDTFNTAIVTPILYVIFTSFVILSSAILFKEWQLLGVVDVLGNVCAFLIIVLGVFLLHAFKDVPIGWGNLPHILKDTATNSGLANSSPPMSLAEHSRGGGSGVGGGSLAWQHTRSTGLAEGAGSPPGRSRHHHHHTRSLSYNKLMSNLTHTRTPSFGTECEGPITGYVKTERPPPPPPPHHPQHKRTASGGGGGGSKLYDHKRTISSGSGKLTGSHGKTAASKVYYH